MPDEPTYITACAMSPRLAVAVAKMIEIRHEFSAITLTVNPDRGTYNSAQSKSVLEGQVLVTLKVPCEGVDMSDFFRRISEVANPRPEGVIRREQER